VDPISTELLLALSGGAGGELGRQAWAALSALVRRPSTGGQGTEDVPAVSTGDAELVELEGAPADAARARALSTALAVRAAVDAEFRTGLERWREQARQVCTGDGEVDISISGGTFYGPTLLGRDFPGTSFATASAPPGDPGSGTPSARD
jgi:hypothetical protein